MMTAAHRLEDRVAIEPGAEKAGQAALAAEKRRAGVTGAGPPLVAIGVGDDADAVILFERVAHDPFEGAPGRVNFDCGFQLRIVGIENVGVTAADMGDDDAILAFKLAEEIVRGVSVGSFVGHVGAAGNLRVG